MSSSFGLFLIFIVLVLPTLGNVMAWGFCRLTRGPVEKVELFCGPKLASFQLLGTPFSIGCLPWGGGVSFDMPAFDLQPRLLRLAVFLTCPAAYVLIARMLLGPEQLMHHLGTGFAQLASGALHPRSVAQDLIAHLEAVHWFSFSEALGIALSKNVCFLFLPGASLLTFQCLQIAASIPRENRILGVLTTINVLASFCVGMMWAVAVVSYAWHPVA